MRTPALAAGLLLLATGPLALADSAGQRTDGPCFNVTIQRDRVNDAHVVQDCDLNVSRTVQVGKSNRAYTHQTGQVNDNKVRQYQFDHWRQTRHIRGQ